MNDRAKNTKNERRNRRIDLLYKNLEHTSNAYFAVESIFPFWESAFALIIGQLFIAYFGNVASHYRIMLSLFGAALSFIWFVLVSLNLKNAQHMDGQIQRLHKQLRDELKGFNTTLEFIDPWITKDEKKSWHWIGNILSGVDPKPKENSIKSLLGLSKSTWLWRRLLPFMLCVWWVW